MEGGRERNCEKESSAETSSGGKEKRAARANWNVMAVRGKVTDRCLWSACKAMTAGFFFILIGAGMATLGFYSDYLSRVPETKGNTTVWVKNEAKDSHLGSLTYLGPIVMGIGGFTIVAACVMTFEARDTAAKIVPIWFKRTRIHVVSGGSGSTPSGRSSKASWERFLSQQRSSEDAADNRTAVTEELVNFSKFLQNSVDTNKFPFQKPVVNNQQIISIRKCPSEPSLVKSQRDANGNNLPETMTVFEASTPQPSQRTTYGGGLKPIMGSSKPQLLSVAPDTYRQAVSMDCPRCNIYEEESKEDNIVVSIANASTSDKSRMQTLPFQTSCATSSSGSMSVDIYLPQGAVTLKVHDDMKDNKRSPLKPTDSDESRYAKYSQHSRMQSFDNDDEFADLDDNVFSNQEPAISAPQIVLDTLDSINRGSTSYMSHSDNHSPLARNNDKASVEQWATTYHAAFPHTENKSESLEVQTPDRSPLSPISTNFSFDCSESHSAGFSVDSVISNPRLSQLCGQPSLSQTDTSFFNVSSLNSMGSSQDISSPLVFCGSPRSFEYDQESSSGNQRVEDYSTSVKLLHGNEIPRKKTYSLSESTRKQVSITLEPDTSEKGHKNSPRKHSSLESAQIPKTRPHVSNSPKRHQLSLEGAARSEDTLLIPPLSPRFLSPKPLSPTASPTALTFSPRKVRSESLPERRQAPSIKRFPLLRQGALDAFAEEGGSVHRLDRSLTQISPKDP